MRFQSESPQETFDWARSLGQRLAGDELILLTGLLGAGKTLFCKGLADGMGIDADEVVSPTFTLLNCHQGDRHTLYHLDLYRIGDREGGITHCPEIDEPLGSAVVVVEWAEYLGSLYWRLPQTLTIRLTVSDDETRLIEVGGAKWVALFNF